MVWTKVNKNEANKGLPVLEKDYEEVGIETDEGKGDEINVHVQEIKVDI